MTLRRKGGTGLAVVGACLVGYLYYCGRQLTAVKLGLGLNCATTPGGAAQLHGAGALFPEDPATAADYQSCKAPHQLAGEAFDYWVARAPGLAALNFSNRPPGRPSPNTTEVRSRPGSR